MPLSIDLKLLRNIEFTGTTTKDTTMEFKFQKSSTVKLKRSISTTNLEQDTPKLSFLTKRSLSITVISSILKSASKLLKNTTISKLSNQTRNIEFTGITTKDTTMESKFQKSSSVKLKQSISTTNLEEDTPKLLFLTKRLLSITVILSILKSASKLLKNTTVSKSLKQTRNGRFTGITTKDTMTVSKSQGISLVKLQQRLSITNLDGDTPKSLFLTKSSSNIMETQSIPESARLLLLRTTISPSSITSLQNTWETNMSKKLKRKNLLPSISAQSTSSKTRRELTDVKVIKNAKEKEHATVMDGAKETTAARSSTHVMLMNNIFFTTKLAQMIPNAKEAELVSLESVLDKVDVHLRNNVKSEKSGTRKEAPDANTTSNVEV